MAETIEQRLKELRIELPQPSKPGANYVPFVRAGNLLFITGQLSQWNGERRFVGKLGREITPEEGYQAARLCALNVIAHLSVALDGNLDRMVRCVRLAGFVKLCAGLLRPGPSDEWRLRPACGNVRRCRPARAHGSGR